MRFLGGLSALLFALALAGCGDDEEEAATTVRETVTETATETGTSSVPDEAPAVLTLFFLRDGKVEPVSRTVVAGPAVARAALTELLKGPQATEEEPGIAPKTAIPDGTELESVSIENGVAVVQLSRAVPRPAQAQVVFTLTQFPSVKLVQFVVEGQPEGPPRARTAFEAQTPAILVLSPLPGEEVESGFEVTGTANTFEATFQYELRDAADEVLNKDFVTATSGSGTRGTFSFTVPYEVANAQYGKLVVFEISAEDGSRTNERSISLALR